MAEFPSLPIWTDAFLADTTHLTALELGAFTKLIICMWRSPMCDLPADDKTISRYAGITRRQWEKIRGNILPFFRTVYRFGGERLQQYRLRKQKADIIKRRASLGKRRRKKGSGYGMPKSLRNLPTFMSRTNPTYVAKSLENKGRVASKDDLQNRNYNHNYNKMNLKESESYNIHVQNTPNREEPVMSTSRAEEPERIYIDTSQPVGISSLSQLAAAVQKGILDIEEPVIPPPEPETERAAESPAVTDVIDSVSEKPAEPAPFIAGQQKASDASVLLLPVPEAAKKPNNIREMFEVFWNNVPRREQRKPAFAAFEKAIKSKVATAEQMIEGIKRYSEWTQRNGRERQYIALPATWINKERWNDELVDDARNVATIGRANGNADSAEYGLTYVSSTTKTRRDLAKKYGWDLSDWGVQACAE